MAKLSSCQYDQECAALARYLLGKILVRKLENGTVLKGRIVETEAYLGGEDKASHSYNGKITDRNKPMYAPPGTSYVYSIYGMYYCINISSQGPGAAVLLRALEPTENSEEMQLQRRTSKKGSSKSLTLKDLCNGPSKLCMSLNITKDLNNIFMPESDVLWIERSEEEDWKVVESARVGIEKCGAEWASKKLRFYIYSNPCVSKRDKKGERELVESRNSIYFS